ncbi:alpha-N-acetylgalactosaminidase [Helicoverpa armigera]|uniref:alpha-N-acetylgalactosaminidase n=1 Tax=Helicoverpa armigera TaxID=29058 RepID=UPI003083CC61
MIKGSSCNMFYFRCVLFILFFAFSLDKVDLLENGMALTPPMGWMSWGYYMCSTKCEEDEDKCLNEKLILSVADSFYNEGYQEAGYEYIIIDDCWSERHRDENGRLVPDKRRFPRGMKFLADYIHSKGLKFGIYTNIANVTCMRYPGSYSHLDIDAQTFAEWGVDYLKVDGCFVTEDYLNVGYIDLGLALNRTGRPMVYSCSWPYYIEYIHNNKPNYTEISKYCNMWRNYHDVQTSWDAILGIIQHYRSRYKELAPHHGPGHWNDPDMLIFGTGVLTHSQSRVHLAVLAMLSAPILLSCDMKKITPYEKKLLQNLDIIAVAQDPMGIMAQPYKLPDLWNGFVWVKPHLPKKGDQFPSYTFAFVNLDIDESEVSITLSTYHLNNTDGYTVLDVFSGEFIRNVTYYETFEVTVPGVDVIMYTLYPL